MSFFAIFSIRKKRSDLADVAWGLGFILVAWTSYFLSGTTFFGYIINFLITIWGIRLGIHIYLRNRNRPEDFRYQQIQRNWNKYYKLRIFFQIYMLQGCLLFFIAMPIVWIHTHQQNTCWALLFLSLPVWLIGFLLETISDYQLLNFMKIPKNKGKILITGVWQYVRHPNYLGEILQWWAIWLIAISIPYGWALIGSPILITYLIIKVTGIPPLEEKMKNKPGFEAYAKNTPMILPNLKKLSRNQ